MADIQYIEVGKRLKELREKFGLTQFLFGGKIKYSQNLVSENEQGGKKNKEGVKIIASRYLDMVSTIYGVNRKWLETGVVEMFSPKNSTFEEGLPQYHTTGNIAKGKEAFKVSTEDGPRPYYNVDFAEGFEKIFEDEGLAPSYYIDYKPCEDVGWWVNVTGNGMHPVISNGDVISVKKVEDWQTFLMPDEIYGIITTNGLKTIRTVCFGNDADYFSLIPSNKDYQTVEMPKNIISTVLKVRTVFKKAF